MNRTLLACLVGLTLIPAPALAAEERQSSAPKESPVPLKDQRFVFLGDSITDGNTYPLLVRQALIEAKEPAPTCINAGIGGDTAAGMRKRLDRDVLVHHPNLVTVSAGINDVLHRVKPADYEADMTAIVEQLQTKDVKVVLLTTSVLGPKHAEADRALAEYNAILHRLAEKYGCRVAEVNRLMQEARSAGKELLDEDQVHPNFEGHRLMARAVLDALGYPQVQVPHELKVELLPGLVREWKMRAAPKPDVRLDAAAVEALKPDDTWKTLTLPEKEPITGWWRELERQQGMAQSLDRLIGPARRYQGVATVEAERAHKAFVNPAAHVETIWVNGKRVYENDGWHGWHIGRERIPIELQAGRNTIVIETGPAFAVSVTDTNTW